MGCDGCGCGHPGWCWVRRCGHEQQQLPGADGEQRRVGDLDVLGCGDRARVDAADADRDSDRHCDADVPVVFGPTVIDLADLAEFNERRAHVFDAYSANIYCAFNDAEPPEWFPGRH